MSIEEEHREELKWVLQRIKKELLHAGDLVDFNASRLTNRDPDSPSLDAIYKHLKDLERATVIRFVERYDGDGYSAYGYSLDAEARVTGYKFVVDREKFETFYHAMVEVKVHRKDLSSDDAVDFDEEKERISAIGQKEDYDIELSRWTWTKNILDQIYIQLAPNEAHGQTIRQIDISKVPESISRGILGDLWDRGICGYGGPLSGESERIAMRNGNHILIRDIDRFRTYRDGVSDFVKWIKRDGVERFSEKETGGQAPLDGTSLEKLSSINFLSVCDVAMDIEEKLQMTDKDVVYVPVVKKSIVRFPILLPAATINLMDEYGDHRVRGATYLKNNGSILNYEFQRGSHRWDTNMKITLDPKKFRRFYERLQAVYQERVVDPTREAAGRGFQVDGVSNARPPVKEISDEAVLTQIESDRLGADTSTFFKLPIGTGWREMTIKFKTDELIEVLRGGHRVGQASFRELGFGIKKPDQRWRFLYLLATIYAASEHNVPQRVPATVDDVAYSLLKGVSKQKKAQIQTLRTQLAVGLKTGFGIDDDPFEDYDETEYYKTKFELQPEPVMRQDKPYENAKQLHEGVERVGSTDRNTETIRSNRSGDAHSFGESFSDDDDKEDILDDEML